jgi:iron complex outermembrane receptor protein
MPHRTLTKTFYARLLAFGLVVALPLGLVHGQSSGKNTAKKAGLSDTIRLQTTVVSASRYAQRLETTTTSIDALPASILKNKPLLKVEDALIQTPGVTIQDGQANIRSGSGWSYGVGSRVQVLLDGLPLLSPDAAQASWSLVPVEAIQHVEVVKGAASALYGSAALNGVIHVRTLEAGAQPVARMSFQSLVYDQPEFPSMRWWAGTGMRTQGTGRFAVAVKPTAKSGLVLHGQLQWDEGYVYGVTDESLRFNAKYDYSVSKKMKVGMAASVRGLRGADVLLWKSFANGYIPLDSTATNKGIYQVTASPFVTYRQGRTLHALRSRFFAHDNNLQAGLEDYSNAARTLYTEYTATRFGARGWNTTWGASATNSLSLNGELFGGKHTSTTRGLFAQADYSKGAWNASLGGRYERYTLDTRGAGAPIFRAGLNRDLGGGRFVRASAGQGYRFPTIAEAFVSAVAGPVKVYSNPLAKPERSASAEIGLKQLLATSDRRWQGYADVVVFASRYWDMLEFTFGQWGDTVMADPAAQFFANNGFKSINVGTTQVVGAEFTLTSSVAIRKNLTVNGLLGYTYARPTTLDRDATYAFDAAGRPITYLGTSTDPSHGYLKYRYRHVAKADVEVVRQRWSAGLSVRYNNRMDNMDSIFTSSLFNAFVPGVQDAYAYYLPHYDLLLDARVKWQLSRDWAFTAQVNNLLNRTVMPRPASLLGPRTFGFQIAYALGGR